MQHIKSMFFQYRGLSRAAYILFLGRMITNMGTFIWPLLTLILSPKALTPPPACRFFI